MKKERGERIIIEFEVNGSLARALQRAGKQLLSIFAHFLKDLLKDIIIRLLKKIIIRLLPGIEQLLGGAVMILNLPLFTAVVLLTLLLRALVL